MGRVASLDFGASKIALAVGEQVSTGIRIISYHDAPATGIVCGEIFNDGKVKAIVSELLDKAQREIGEPITEIVVGLSGKAIHCKDVPCQGRRRNPADYISQEEVDHLTKTQFNTVLENGDSVYEVSPQRYNIDDIVGIPQSDIIGMTGNTIEAEFKVFSGKRAIMDHRRVVLDGCGIRISKAVLASVASARAVLTRPEMENGAALVDIGESCTEVAVVKDNIVRHVAVIPFGGESVTNDIKSVANITSDWAETIKLRHGNCCEEYTPDNKKLILRNENKGIDGEVELCQLTRIIEARMSEIFDAVRYVIEQSGYASRLNSGVVITGGCSHLDNVLQLAGAIIGQKVRLGAPRNSIDGRSVEEAFDVYSSTAVGLVLEGISPLLSHARKQGSIFKSIAERTQPAPAPAPSVSMPLIIGAPRETAPVQEQPASPAEQQPVQPAEPVQRNLFGNDPEEAARDQRREAERMKRDEERRRKEQEKARKEQMKKEKKEEERRRKENRISGPSLFDKLFDQKDDA